MAAQALTRRLQADADAQADDALEPEPRSRRGWWLAIAAAVVVAGAWTAWTMTQRQEVVTEAAPRETRDRRSDGRVAHRRRLPRCRPSRST